VLLESDQPGLDVVEPLLVARVASLGEQQLEVALDPREVLQRDALERREIGLETVDAGLERVEVGLERVEAGLERVEAGLELRVPIASRRNVT